MKTLGLIGGMTWHSTVDYYRLINQGVQERLGGSHSAEILMRSVDFDPVEGWQNQGDWTAMGRLMAGTARVLEQGGAEAIVICANTMHRLAGDIGRRGPETRPEDGRAARHALHDGARLLPGTPGLPARIEGPRARGAGTDDRPRRHL